MTTHTRHDTTTTWVHVLLHCIWSACKCLYNTQKVDHLFANSPFSIFFFFHLRISWVWTFSIFFSPIKFSRNYFHNTHLSKYIGSNASNLISIDWLYHLFSESKRTHAAFSLCVSWFKLAKVVVLSSRVKLSLSDGGINNILCLSCFCESKYHIDDTNQKLKWLNT